MMKPNEYIINEDNRFKTFLGIFYDKMKNKGIQWKHIFHPGTEIHSTLRQPCSVANNNLGHATFL